MPDASIVLGWVGVAAEDEALMTVVGEHVERTFGMPVVRRRAEPPPDTAFDPRRRQWASSKMLSWLAERRPENASKILGVTDADLFIPILTFVFGEAQLGGAAAVVSTARLATDGSGRRREVVARRLRTECVHELGHTFGLIHCDGSCAMARSPGLPEVDAKKEYLCPECRVRFQDLRRETEARHE